MLSSGYLLVNISRERQWLFINNFWQFYFNMPKIKSLLLSCFSNKVSFISINCYTRSILFWSCCLLGTGLFCIKMQRSVVASSVLSTGINYLAWGFDGGSWSLLHVKQAEPEPEPEPAVVQQVYTLSVQ